MNIHLNFLSKGQATQLDSLAPKVGDSGPAELESLTWWLQLHLQIWTLIIQYPLYGKFSPPNEAEDLQMAQQELHILLEEERQENKQFAMVTLYHPTGNGQKR